MHIFQKYTIWNDLQMQNKTEPGTYASRLTSVYNRSISQPVKTAILTM